MITQAYLYLVNSNQDYEDDFVPNVKDFVKVKESPETLSIRKSLQVNSNETSYYLLLCMSLLERHDKFLKKLKVPHTAFSIKDYGVKRSSITGASIEITFSGDEGFTSIDTFGFNYVVQYLDATTVEVYRDSNRFEYTYSSKDLFGEKLLTINWTDVPIKGDIRVSTWAPGNKFYIKYFPRDFNYSKYLTKVTADGAYNKLLQQQGLSEDYAVSKTDPEKLAIIVLALINSTYGAQ
jgi:hypothetical protein